MTTTIADAFVRCVGRVDHAAMRDFGARLKALFRASRGVRVTSREGTDLRCSMNRNRLSRLADKLRGRPRSCVWDPSGQPLESGQATFLEGQLAFLGKPDSIEGTAVVDGFQWPPREIGALREPIVLRIERGVVTAIDGRGESTALLRRWLEGRARNILHFSLGFNPGARMDGELCEAERAFGALTIGFGEHPFHTDAVMRRPSLELSQGVVQVDGRFVHPEVRALAGRLSREI